jgi:hypothetical protein
MTCGLDATAASGNTYGTDCKGLYDMHSNSEFFPEIPYVKYEVLFISAHNCPNWSTILRKEMTERKKFRARISFHFELESENTDLGTCFLVGVCLISKQMSWFLLLHFCSLTISWKRKSQSGDFSYVAVCSFQGPASDNPLSYKWYNAEEVILGKKMKVCTYSQMCTCCRMSQYICEWLLV